MVLYQCIVKIRLQPLLLTKYLLSAILSLVEYVAITVETTEAETAIC